MNSSNNEREKFDVFLISWKSFLKPVIDRKFKVHFYLHDQKYYTYSEKESKEMVSAWLSLWKLYGSTDWELLFPNPYQPALENKS